MFEELIWQGKDIIGRIEAEVVLPSWEREALPPDRRLPMSEEQAWLKTIEERIREQFGVDTYARYKNIWEHFTQTFGEADELTRALIAKRRIVALLIELQGRLDTNTTTSAREPSRGTRLERTERGEAKKSSGSGYEYDVALSFAGEDRGSAESLAAMLRKAGYRVFYDRYEQASLWGQDLYRHLSDVYSKQARYSVVFVSQHYAEKLWTKRELRAAQERAFSESDAYILPIRLDDTALRGLPDTTGYLDLRLTSIETVAQLLVEKLQSTSLSS